MSDQARESGSAKVGAGKAIPMPAYQYQTDSGKSGGASSGRAMPKAGKIPALQNFVFANS